MPEECSVLPGVYGILVQGVLFLTVCGILVLKKAREKAKRTWFEFGLDSSKQIMGSGWIHMMNLACATVLDRLMTVGDQCEWYWVNIVVDTTVGVGVSFVLLKSFLWLLSLCDLEEDFKQGEYFAGGQLQWGRYIKQLILWLIVVTGMKFSMVLLMLTLSTPLEAAANFVLTPFVQNPSVKLLVVMIATPLCMNALQFWIVDNIIKKKEEEPVYHDPHYVPSSD